jgi:ubiquitin-protein ligase
VIYIISVAILVRLRFTPYSSIIKNIIDIAELDGGTVAKTIFPSASDLTFFHVVVSPDSGFWKGATYKFSFTIPPDYPHKPPKVNLLAEISSFFSELL